MIQALSGKVWFEVTSLCFSFVLSFFLYVGFCCSSTYVTKAGTITANCCLYRILGNSGRSLGCILAGIVKNNIFESWLSMQYLSRGTPRYLKYWISETFPSLVKYILYIKSSYSDIKLAQSWFFLSNKITNN